MGKGLTLPFRGHPLTVLGPPLSLGGRDALAGSGAQHPFPGRAFLLSGPPFGGSSPAVSELRLDFTYFFFYSLSLQFVSDKGHL